LRLAGGYRLIGTDVFSQCVNFAAVDVACVVPRAEHPRYLDALLEICRRWNVDAVFPGSQPELRIISAARERLEAAGIFLPINPREVIDVCMDKRVTAAFLDAHGFSRPRCAPLSRPAIENIDWFPVVVKPALGGGGSVNCHIAQNRRELG